VRVIVREKVKRGGNSIEGRGYHKRRFFQRIGANRVR